VTEPGQWAGRLLWRPGLLAYVGPGGRSTRHAHHAVQMAVSFGARFELTMAGRRVRAQASLIPSREPHAFDTGGERIFYALVEPHGARGAALAQCAHELRGLDLAEVVPLGSEPAGDQVSLEAYADELIGSLTPGPPHRPLSPHVVAALEYLDAALQGRPRLDEAARAAHISPSRLSHLFSQQVGIPFRRFVVWLRLRRAAEHGWSSRTLTEAAVAAGFSDMAHLSRVCRSMFGVSPSALQQMQPVVASWPA
jgi:AraC-like DNA-binding protein